MKSLPLAYYAIWPNLFDSPHFWDLQDGLGVSEFLSFALIARIWGYAAENAADGHLRVPLSRLIQKLGWQEEWCPAEKAAQALMDSGFIEGDGKTLHGWIERQPCINARVRKSEIRQQRRTVSDSPGQSRNVPDSPGMSAQSRVVQRKEKKSKEQQSALQRARALENCGQLVDNPAQNVNNFQAPHNTTTTNFEILKISHSHCTSLARELNVPIEQVMEQLHKYDSRMKSGIMKTPHESTAIAHYRNVLALLKVEFKQKSPKIK